MARLETPQHDPLMAVTLAKHTSTKDEVFRGAGIDRKDKNRLGWLYTNLVKSPLHTRAAWLRFFAFLHIKYVPLLFDMIVLVDMIC